MYIFQPDRYLLDRQIQKFAHYITGKTLDVGAGSFNRYERHFQVDSYLKTDYTEHENVDVVASADNLPFADNEFDSVVSTQVFEHLEYPEKAAQEVARVLKPGGHLLITIPQMNELHEEPHDYFRYTRFGLESLFSRHGLKLIELDQRGGYWVMMRQNKTRYLMQTLDLYNRPVLGKVFSKLFKLQYLFDAFLDRYDTSKNNRRHTIGWAAVFKKSL